ncbi:unnamed protein product [Rotaria sp. Silwood1]|nr:unnamed protein product [Rotaria sp. Silwood1]
MPAKIRDLLKEVGDEPILKIQLGRRPVKEFALNILDYLSDSKFLDKQDELVLVLEKSYRIGLRYPIIPDETTDVYDIPLSPDKPLTFNQLITTALNADKNFFVYDAGENNMCQTFVENIIESNGLMPNIVDQATLDALKPIDSKELISALENLSKVVKLGTDLAAKLSRLVLDHKIKLRKTEAKEFISLRNAKMITSKSTHNMNKALF